MGQQSETKWKTATHKAFPDTVVKWRKIVDSLGFETIEFKFKSGETSTACEERFNSLFNKN